MTEKLKVDALLSFTLGHVTHTRFSTCVVVKDSFVFFFYRWQFRGATVSPDAGMNMAFFQHFVAKYDWKARATNVSSRCAAALRSNLRSQSIQIVTHLKGITVGWCLERLRLWWESDFDWFARTVLFNFSHLWGIFFSFVHFFLPVRRRWIWNFRLSSSELATCCYPTLMQCRKIINISSDAAKHWQPLFDSFKMFLLKGSCTQIIWSQRSLRGDINHGVSTLFFTFSLLFFIRH